MMYRLTTASYWRSLGAALVVTFALVACQSDDHSDHHQPMNQLTDEELEAIRNLTRDEQKEACDALDLAPPAEGEGIQLTMGAYYPPYTETEVCKFVQVGPEGLNINSQRVRYTEGSHHMLIFSTPYTELPTVDDNGKVVDTANGNVFACPDGPAPDWQLTGVIGGSQNPEWDPKPYPAGVAAVVAPNSWVIMNLHMLNPSPEGVQTCVKNNFGTIPTEEVEHEAGLLFWYNPFITVAPQGTGSATLRCPITQEITLHNGQSHMHARGSYYIAKLYDDEGTYVKDIYESSNWETPVPTDYEPTMVIPAGYSIEYTCEYTNNEERTVNQGLKTADEMCMFIGQYYPRDVLMDDCGPATGFVSLGEPSYEGETNGAESLECWFGSQGVDGNFTAAQQDCMTDSCAAPQIWDYLLCAGDNGAACAQSCQVPSNVNLYTNHCMGGCQEEMVEAQATCGTDELIAAHRAVCTTETPMATYQATCESQTGVFSAVCLADQCAELCADPTAEACTTCATNCVTDMAAGCMQKLVGDCVTELVTACVTQTATACIQPCVVDKITNCATECLNTVVCAEAYDTVVATECE